MHLDLLRHLVVAAFPGTQQEPRLCRACVQHSTHSVTRTRCLSEYGLRSPTVNRFPITRPIALRRAEHPERALDSPPRRRSGTLSVTRTASACRGAFQKQKTEAPGPGKLQGRGMIPRFHPDWHRPLRLPGLQPPQPPGSPAGYAAGSTVNNALSPGTLTGAAVAGYSREGTRFHREARRGFSAPRCRRRLPAADPRSLSGAPPTRPSHRHTRTIGLSPQL